jgi:RNA polymerase sigma-70 factor (ECF subfamily)
MVCVERTTDPKPTEPYGIGFDGLVVPMDSGTCQSTSDQIESARTIEAHLINRLATGDERAAEVFVREYQPRVLRMLGQLGVPNADIPDVTQDVLFDAIRQLRAGRFRRDSRLFSWLKKVIRGKAIVYPRQAARRRENATIPFDPTETTHAVSLTIAAAQDALCAAAQAMTAMPARLQTIVRLHYYDNIPIEEIALRFGLSGKRVRGLLIQAKVSLRREICR